MASSDVFARLRHRRDEQYAHLLKGVSGRKDKEQRLNLDRGYSHNEVLDTAQLSISLISEAIRIWRFEVHADSETAAMCSKYYERYWAYMPNLSELEGN